MENMKEVTPAEAIELLETKYHMEGRADNVLESLAIRLTAVNALKKQVQKKPIKDSGQKIRYISTYSCPACGGGFDGMGIEAYCHRCGQALDWKN